MKRRHLLDLAAGAAAGAAFGCAPVPSAPDTVERQGSRRAIKAICFDLFTLFDPRGVISVASGIVEDAPAFCEAWRNRQFQYAFLRAAGDRYEPFDRVTEEALRYAAKDKSVVLNDADRRRLLAAYCELAPWPDTRDTLQRLRAAGLKLAPLANYAPKMIDALLAHADLAAMFDVTLSTDRARTFKPDPRAYALGPSAFGLDKREIVFSAFGGWDAAGAVWFGYPTFWVNRLGVTPDELGPAPDGTGPTLEHLAAFVSSWV